MNRRPLVITSLTTAGALFAASCAEMSPGENAAVFGTSSAIVAGTLASAAGLSTGESFAVGAATGAIVAATVYVIAKHQATERQRRLAEERARVAYAKRQSRLAHEASAAKKSGSSKAPAKKHARYIAVETEKSAQAPAKTKKSVMIFDTQSQEIVGNDVYDVQSTPPVGGTAKFDTYTAEYVGNGG